MVPVLRYGYHDQPIILHRGHTPHGATRPKEQLLPQLSCSDTGNVVHCTPMPLARSHDSVLIGSVLIVWDNSWGRLSVGGLHHAHNVHRALHTACFVSCTLVFAEGWSSFPTSAQARQCLPRACILAVLEEWSTVLHGNIQAPFGSNIFFFKMRNRNFLKHFSSFFFSIKKDFALHKKRPR